MTLLILLLLAVALVALAGVAAVAYRSDHRQIQARTRRHLEAGGRIGDAPDLLPPHGGGASG